MMDSPSFTSFCPSSINNAPSRALLPASSNPGSEASKSFNRSIRAAASYPDSTLSSDPALIFSKSCFTSSCEVSLRDLKPSLTARCRKNFRNVEIVWSSSVFSPLLQTGPFAESRTASASSTKTLILLRLSPLDLSTMVNRTLSKCAESILPLEERALNCYYPDHQSQTMLANAQKSLAEILLVDGCFILEVFLRYFSRDPNVEDGDPIFGSAWMIYTLQRDLALLENQIPFFVLESLYEDIVKRIPQRPSYSLGQLAFFFFGSALKLNPQSSSKRALTGKHLLDLIRNCCLPTYRKTELKNTRKAWEYVHSVTKLGEAGIAFVPASSDNWFDIKFSNGVLEIPRLYIQDATDSLFRNLIAYEQCCHGTTHHITSYAILMDRLIDSSEDAELLEKERVIANYLGRGEDVSKIFNNLCKEVVVTDFFFAALSQEVDEYYNSWIPRKTAYMKRNYCSNSCRTIAFLVATLLVLLTILQTGYNVSKYYYHG